MSRILARLFLTEKEYNNSLTNGVTVFLYNEINFVPEPKEGVSLVNCTTERVPSTWFTWQKNEVVFESFKVKFPQFFQWGKYDMSLAFQKALYWSNQKTGFLQYVKNRDYPKLQVWKENTLYESSLLKVMLKYCNALLRKHNQKKNDISKEKNGLIGVFIKNEFQVTLYKHILSQCADNDKYLFFILDKKTEEAIINLGITNRQIVYCKHKRNRKIPWLNIVLLNSRDIYVLNQIVNNWVEVEKWIGVAEQMVSHGISKALINEAENGLFGAVLGEVFQKHGVISYNTMNGMKAGQAQDSYINFDYWFVWDEKMKELLMQKNKLPENKLIVSGHLMEDEVRDYQYQNSLPLCLDEIKGKKVISLFSVRGKREEKLEAFNCIYALLSQWDDLILLVRKHPGENETDTLLPPQELTNVYWVDYTPINSKTTLYDQLCISDLSVCFGSTVALESKWFGVHSITYEKREESLIYTVDNEWIFHVKEISSFKDILIDNLSMSKRTYNSVTNVSDLITSNLIK